MATQRKIFGRIPTYRGNWSEGVPVKEKFRFTFRGSEFQALMDGLTTPPLNEEDELNDGWIIISNGTEAYRAGEKLDRYLNDTDVYDSVFVKVVTDNDGKLLFAIRKDGDIVFGVGVPCEIKSYMEGVKTTLQTIITEQGASISTLNSVIEYALTRIPYELDCEYIQAVLSQDDHIIYAVKPNGEVVIGIIEGTNTHRLSILDDLSEEYQVSEVINTEEFISITLSAENKILKGIRNDGTIYVASLDSPIISEILNRLNNFRPLTPEQESALDYAASLETNSNGIIPKNTKWLGNYKKDSRYDTPDGFFPEQTIFTQGGFTQDQDLVIQTIFFYANQAGTIKFGIGTIDQRSWAIVADEFTVKCVAGYNEINIQQLCKRTLESGRLFAYNNYDGKGTCIGYKNVTSLSSNCIVYSDNSQSALVNSLDETGSKVTYSAFADVKGNAIPLLSYKVITDSLFYGTSSEVSNIGKWTEYSQDKAGMSIAQKNLIRGDNGKLYKLRVSSDGTLKAEEFTISKVTLFGNSIFTHGAISSFLYPHVEEGVTWNYAGEPDGGMSGMNGRGMAASQQEFDFKHLLLKGLQKLNPDVIVQGANIAGIERGRSDGTFAMGSAFGYTNLLTNDVDVIIWRAGENVSMVNEAYRSALRSWVKYFQQRCPKALIIMTGRFWRQEACDDITAEVADEFGLPYIKMYMDSLYQADGMDILQYPVTDGVNTKNVYGVASGGGGHPGNIGMYKIADKLLKTLGAEPLNCLYDIYVDNISGLGVTYKPKQIAGAIGYMYYDKSFTGTISVIGRTSKNPIPFEHIDYQDISASRGASNIRYIIFTMPDEDVTIIIS